MVDKRIAVVIAVVITFLIFYASSYYMKSDTVKAEIYINGKQISVEVADTAEKRIRGLMFHEPLRDSEGMLLVFDSEGYHGIWMPNMSFPLDVVWINGKNDIVYIERNIQPCESMPCRSYKPDKPVLYILELKANSTSDFNIGDNVDLSEIRK